MNKETEADKGINLTPPDRWKFYKDNEQIKFQLHDAYLEEDKEKMRWKVVFEMEALSGENTGYWVRKYVYDPIVNPKTKWYAGQLFKKLGLPEEEAEYDTQTELLSNLGKVVGTEVVAKCTKREWNGRDMTNWDDIEKA